MIMASKNPVGLVDQGDLENFFYSDVVDYLDEKREWLSTQIKEWLNEVGIENE